MNNNKETVQFTTNEPVHVTLAFETGKQVNSRYDGAQVMYTLKDGRVMFLPPEVADTITGLGAKTGDTLVITKRRSGFSVQIESKPHVVHNNAPMIDSLVTAIDAAAEAEVYAKSIGRPLEFSTEDIRAIALTLFIQRTRS